MQQSMIRRKYHGKLVTYLVMLTQRFRNSQEWDTTWMMCRRCTSQVAVDDVTWKSHKMITQINHTNELHKMITQGKMKSRPRMEMTGDAFGCSRATQVCMEDLRLVSLTEICLSQKGEQFKAPC